MVVETSRDVIAIGVVVITRTIVTLEGALSPMEGIGVTIFA